MTRDNEFLGKNILVTGASKGIGEAVAQRLQESGASVLVLRRTLVAVVDDDESIRKALHRIFKPQFDTALFASGEEFLKSLGSALPDCVILDFQLGSETAHDVQRELNAARVQLPIIILTAHEDPQARERCLADGALAYLVKPVARLQLLDHITSASRNNRGATITTSLMR